MFANSFPVCVSAQPPTTYPLQIIPGMALFHANNREAPTIAASRERGGITGILADARRLIASVAARILVCIGADDPFIPPEQRAGFEAEMRAADARSWAAMEALFGQTLRA